MRLSRFALALTLVASPLAAETWTLSTIDDVGIVGQHVAIGTRYGKTHVAYYDVRNGDLRYAVTTDDKTWKTEVVDTSGDVGQYASIFVDIKGYPHIAYYDATNEDLKYAVKVTSSWTIDVVDANHAGRYSSIAVNDEHVVYISYLSTAGWNLKCAKGKPGNWLDALTDFTNVVGLGTSIALDAKARGHISYTDYTAKALKYAFENGSFDVFIVDPVDVGVPTAIGVDGTGFAHIAYLSGGLRYTTNATGDFVSEGVDNTTGFSEDSDICLAVTEGGAPFITYHDGTANKLKLARRNAGVWTTEALDEGGQYNAIALDEKGRIRIAYFRDGLRYAITE